jgi:hypothetical protein
MTGELMGVRAEVWPVAASEEGLWLLSGVEGLLSGPVPVRMSVHDAVRSLLRSIGIEDEHLAILHGTSCRDDYGDAIQTHVAVIGCPDVLAHWPAAEPISLEVLGQVGPPPPHGAAEVPDNRYIDVLAHALRHLAFLQAHDATAAAAMPPLMARHLAALSPVLYVMYDQLHEAA